MKNLKTIGQDIDIDTNINEGYMMLDFNEDEEFNKDTDCRIYCYWPEYTEYKGEILIDVTLSFNDVLEMYKEDEESINSFAETNLHVNFEIPTVYDLLNLSSDVNAYKGLE